MTSDRTVNATDAKSSSLDSSNVDGRLMSIDALRGFDMFWIVGGSVIADSLNKMHGSRVTTIIKTQMEHAKWEGFTFCDLIFPLFIFISGMSIVFSLSKSIQKHGRPATIKKVIRRSVLLFIMGLIYNGGWENSIQSLRLMGVLQRIALCYLFTGILFCFFRPRVLAYSCAGILVVYWAAMTFIPVPGVGAGDFSAPEMNLSNWIDSKILPFHLHNNKSWDPEGAFSTLPAIASCLFGVFAGLLLKDEQRESIKKVKILVMAGAIALLAGWLWHFQFPIIKKIWTSSYVLVAAGFSAWLMAIFYYIIDIREYRRWASPFVWIGMNPITIYFLARLINFRRLAARVTGGPVQALLDAHLAQGLGGLVTALASMCLVMWVCWFLYRKKIFLRV